MFKVDGATATRMRPEALESLRILETTHLEQWIVDHPEVLGDDVKIVTTQYDKWSSDSGDLAKERLDILALDNTGQTIVVELKRSSDSRIHLQAITYASLVTGFGKTTLAEAHADYLNRHAIRNGVITSVSADEARTSLAAHVHADWESDILTQPKIILIAENFSAQTYTTVQWRIS